MVLVRFQGGLGTALGRPWGGLGAALAQAVKMMFGMVETSPSCIYIALCHKIDFRKLIQFGIICIFFCVESSIALLLFPLLSPHPHPEAKSVSYSHPHRHSPHSSSSHLQVPFHLPSSVFINRALRGERHLARRWHSRQSARFSRMIPQLFKLESNCISLSLQDFRLSAAHVPMRNPEEDHTYSYLPIFRPPGLSLHSHSIFSTVYTPDRPTLNSNIVPPAHLAQSCAGTTAIGWSCTHVPGGREGN